MIRKESERDGGRERKRERESVCLCVHMMRKERARERTDGTSYNKSEVVAFAIERGKRITPFGPYFSFVQICVDLDNLYCCNVNKNKGREIKDRKRYRLQKISIIKEKLGHSVI